jgi:hypothetical protein
MNVLVIKNNLMHRSLTCLILTIRLVETVRTSLTNEHMSMFVVKSVVIQIKAQSRDLSVIPNVKKACKMYIFMETSLRDTW